MDRLVNVEVSAGDRKTPTTAIGGSTGENARQDMPAQVDLAEIVRMAGLIGGLPEAPLAMPKQALERPGLRASFKALRQRRADDAGWHGEGRELIPARGEVHSDAPQGMRHLQPRNRNHDQS